MQSTQTIAADHGCSVQAINKARRKAEQDHNLKLGSPDPRDKRVMLFTPQEVALILQYAPPPKAKPVSASGSEPVSEFRSGSEPVSETVSESFDGSDLDGELMPEFPGVPPALVVFRPRPLTKNPNLLAASAPEIIADTSVLDRGIRAAHSASAYSANELVQYTESFVEARFTTMLAGLDHAIAAMGANALNKKVQDLSQPQPAPTQKTKGGQHR